MNVAINGFGRIGRNFLRAYLQDEASWRHFTISTINIGHADKKNVSYLFAYDTLMGTFTGKVDADDSFLYINDKKIKIIAEENPEKLPWKQEKIDFVVDCSGAYTTREKATLHQKSGAKFVLISAPAHQEDISIIPGVNMNNFDYKKHTIISLGSCTTNALIPLLHVLHQAFTVEHAYMNTVHAYTNSQTLLDGEKRDLRMSRAAALNIIPTTSGALSMVEKVLPDLKGKVSGISLRVPVGKISFLDLSYVTSKKMNESLITDAIKNSMKSSMRSIIDITNKPLVSSDFFGNPYSVVVDESLIKVQGPIGKVFGWYDNEWGYSVRLKDFLVHAAQQIK